MNTLLLALLLDVVNPTGGAGGGSVASGTTPVSGCQNRLLYGNNSNVVECEAALGYDAATNIATVTNITLSNQLVLSGSTATGYVVGVGNNDGAFKFSTNNTPDLPQMVTGPTSNSWHIMEFGDIGFDFNNGPCGTSACTDPTLVVHSHNQATNEWVGLWHNGNNAVLRSTLGGPSLQGGTNRGVADNTITTFVRIDIPSGTVHGGLIRYCVDARDAGTLQSRCGTVSWSGVNLGGTETCTAGTPADAFAGSAGTLSVTFATETGGTNQCGFRVTADTSIVTPTTLDLKYSIDCFHTATCTWAPQ